MLLQVTPKEVIGTPELIQIKYETILKDLVPGDTIFINDGIIKLVVESKDEEKLGCVVEAGPSPLSPPLPWTPLIPSQVV